MRCVIGVNATAKRLELKLNVASSGASGVWADPKQLSREAAPGGLSCVASKSEMCDRRERDSEKIGAQIKRGELGGERGRGSDTAKP